MDASVALADLGETVDIARVAATNHLDLKQRSELGQILTPHFVAKLMADRLSLHRDSIRLLDPGAGIGSLTAAVVERILQSDQRPASLHVDAFEIDPALANRAVDVWDGDSLRTKCNTVLATHFRMKCSMLGRCLWPAQKFVPG